MKTIYTIEQIRAIEASVFESGVTEAALMQTAGQAAFYHFQDVFPKARKILVVAGKGNNAGDGFVLAELAHKTGLLVDLQLCDTTCSYHGPAKQAFERCLSAGIKPRAFDSDCLIHADVIIDAIFGIGLQGSVREPYRSIITAVNQSQVPVYAVDIPSGLHAETGWAQGIAVEATHTVTFIAVKAGLFQEYGRQAAGKVYLADLGIQPQSQLQQSCHHYLLEAGDQKPYLTKRSRQSHKGNFGHVLVIAGNHGMAGAAMLTAEAALRSGAGLVSVATRQAHAGLIACRRPELMPHPVETQKDLTALLKRATVVAIGNGLGQDAWAEDLLDSVLDTDLPLVIDADGLNLLSQRPAYHSSRWILTPHPGEAARLLTWQTEQVVQERAYALDELQRRYHGVTVLKGAGTWITDGYDYFLCAHGNPGMATPGMGDVLSGIIAGLAAQKLSLAEAARLGVLLQSLAADYAAEQTGERGLLATDLFQFLPSLINA